MEQTKQNGLRFDRVRKAIATMREQEKREKVADIKKIDFATMKPRPSGYGYQWENGDATKRVYTKNTLTEREQTKTAKEQREKLTAKEIKTIDKKYAGFFSRLERYENGDTTAPEQIEMSIDWTQSRTWGANPRARVWVNGCGYAESERVTGYGYCKRSTASADSLARIGQLKTIITALLNTYKIADIVKILGSGYNRDAATLGAYGFHFGGLVYYFGAGCGMSAINEELDNLGYKQIIAHEPDTGSDFYLWQFDKTSENGRKVIKALRAASQVEHKDGNK